MSQEGQPPEPKRARTTVQNPYNRGLPQQQRQRQTSTQQQHQTQSTTQQGRETATIDELSTLNAERTRTNYSDSIKRYNKYAASCVPQLPPYDQLKTHHLTSDEANLGLRRILHGFAEYLMHDVWDDGKDYAANSMLGYLSNFKTVLCKNPMFQRLEAIKDINVQKKNYTWYSELHQALKMRAYCKAIEKGESVTSDTLPVVRENIIAMNRHFIQKDDPGSFEKQAVLTALRQAVGRGGEIGTSIWKTCSWNIETEMLEIEWPEEKTGTANLMTFSRDNDNLEVDFFHSMACYLMTQEGRHGSTNQSKYLFPCFANLQKGGASAKVHKAIKECVGVVNGISSNMSPSGVRVGASDEMVFNPLLNLSAAIVRGG